MTISIEGTKKDVDANGEPFEWLNESGEPDDLVVSSVREVANQVSQWVKSTRAIGGTRPPSMFNRVLYSVSESPYEQMHVARQAVRNDDIIGGVADVTEALMFDGLKFEGPDVDDADIWNQIAADLNLDGFARACHRELFTCSQVVVAMWMGRKTYQVRGTTTPTEEDVPNDPAEVDPMADPVTQATQEAQVVEQTAKVRKGRKRRRQYDLTLPVQRRWWCRSGRRRSAASGWPCR
jgi:hypothetical protein